MSIATKEYLIALGERLSKRIPELAGREDLFSPWTQAVYDSLKEELRANWRISPEEKLYKGEYLCDFMLFESNYGCRLACESQWMHWRNDHQSSLDWAFDKLLGVKSDVKLFICEGPQDYWKKTKSRYLIDYCQLSSEEGFLTLRWENKRFHRSWWKPTKTGVSPTDITFFDC